MPLTLRSSITIEIIGRQKRRQMMQRILADVRNASMKPRDARPQLLAVLSVTLSS